MNKTWNNIISKATLTFTIAAIFTTLYNLAYGHTQGNYLLLLELFGFTVCLEIIDYILSYITFHSRPAYICTEFVLMYILFLIFSHFGHWFGFTPIHLIIFSGTFVSIFLLLHGYYHFLLKTEAADINNQLNNRNN